MKFDAISLNPNDFKGDPFKNLFTCELNKFQLHTENYIDLYLILFNRYLIPIVGNEGWTNPPDYCYCQRIIIRYSIVYMITKKKIPLIHAELPKDLRSEFGLKIS